ncbi:ankyrin repeat domain-containing protein [Candidatus Dependentiae bacterium]|nr:ankyrin repeat domain-containing protein [Candidatus Dependentiae bacterium]
MKKNCLLFIFCFVNLNSQEGKKETKEINLKIEQWASLPTDLKKELTKELIKGIYPVDGKSLIQVILDFVPIRQSLVKKLVLITKRPASEIGKEIDGYFAEIIKQKYAKDQLDRAILDAFITDGQGKIIGNLFAINTLLDAGADIDSRNSFNQTPLHFAVRSQALKIIDLLIKRGASINSTDKAGETPLKYAEFKGAEVIDILKKAGAK